jgi:hypothetical protein
MTTYRTILCALLAASAACTGAEKSIPTDDFAELAAAGADEKSDSFSKNMRVVASMAWNQTSDAIAYTRTPKYRVVKLSANLGDHLDAWIRSTDGGDAVAWLLDSSFHILVKNDDGADDTLDSHLVFDFGPAKSTTYYIALRDYSLGKATFTVEVDGGPLLKECNTDADCVRVTTSCCGLNNEWDSVLQGDETEFHALLACPSHQLCPHIVIPDNHAMAECNATTHLCEPVLPKNISCGGFVVNPHACPESFDCVLSAGPDRPGTCAQSCSAGCDAGTFCNESTQHCG